MEKLVRKLGGQCAHMDESDAELFIRSIMESKRIFVHGVGRSGMIARAFAMRLMHLGFTVYVVGETITPAIYPEDLFIAVSGSGKTSSVYIVARAAKKKKARVAAITSDPNSELARGADLVVRVRGRVLSSVRQDYDARQLVGEHEPLAPLGTLFELSAMVFLDSIVDELMLRKKKSEKEMRAKHTDLE